MDILFSAHKETTQRRDTRTTREALRGNCNNTRRQGLIKHAWEAKSYSSILSCVVVKVSSQDTQFNRCCHPPPTRATRPREEQILFFRAGKQGAQDEWPAELSRENFLDGCCQFGRTGLLPTADEERAILAQGRDG